MSAEDDAANRVRRLEDLPPDWQAFRWVVFTLIRVSPFGEAERERMRDQTNDFLLDLKGRVDL